MIKHQVHEEFITFSAPTFDVAATKAETFAASVAAKSLATIHHGDQYYVSLGFRRDEAPYPIEICAVALEDPTTVPLDTQLADAEDNVNGDVICHSFFRARGEVIMLALMLHG